MVAEGDRLSALEVSEARHQRRRMLLRLRQQRALQREHLVHRAVAGFSDPEAEIERDLVVTRPRCMQPAGRRADQFLEPLLDVEVNVLELVAVPERPVRDLSLDGGEPASDRRLVFGRDDALGSQHGDVRFRAGEILPGEALVGADRDIDRLHQRAGLG